MKSRRNRSILGTRSLGISVLLTVGLAMPLGCGGGSSSTSTQGSNGGAAGSGADAGGSGGFAGGSGGSGGSSGSSGAGGSAAGGSAGATDAGPDSSASDAGTDASCQPTNGGVEICDGIDNDCNGKTDDNVAVGDGGLHTGDPCTGCSAVWACPAFGSTPVCQAEAGASTEICDGIDNDCNGKIDDGIAPQACDVPNKPGLTYQSTEAASICKQGTQTCSGGAWGTCTGYVGPKTETCDGKDDDCNGVVDDYSPASAPTCTPTSPSGLYCDANGNVVTTVPEVCASGSWVCPAAGTLPFYFYLDADGDGYPEPLSGMGLRGPTLYNYNPGPYCTTDTTFRPTVVGGAPSGAKWITSNYDWRIASQRTADPKHQLLNGTNSGFDCCDADARAKPGQTTYYQAKKSGGDNPLPAACGTSRTSQWDFNCDGSLQRKAPDGSGTAWNQNANNCNHTPGWDTLLPHPQDCGQTQGHWLHQWTVCSPTNWLDGYAPQCH